MTSVTNLKSRIHGMIWIVLALAVGCWGLAHHLANQAEKNAASSRVTKISLASTETEAPEVRQSAMRTQSAVEKILGQQRNPGGSDALADLVWKATKDASQAGELSKTVEAELAKRMAESSPDELAALIAVLDSSSASKPVAEQIEVMIYEHLAAKEVRKSLELGLPRMYTASQKIRKSLYQIFQTWGRNQPNKAEAWLDQQIAAGMLDSQSADGMNRPRNGFEIAMLDVYVYLPTLDAFKARVEKIPPDIRKFALEAIQHQWVRPHLEKELMEVVRTHLSKDIATEAVMSIATGRAMDTGYDAASQTLKTAEFNQEEIARAVKMAAGSQIYKLSCKGTVSQKDFDDARNWIRSMSPETLNSDTSALLVLIAQTRRPQKYEESLSLLDSLQGTPEFDMVLYGYLDELIQEPLMKRSVTLVDRISNPALREKARNHLQQRLKTR